MSTSPTCVLPDCERRRASTTLYCRGHRARVWRYGDPQASIPLKPDGRTIQVNVDTEGNRFVCSEECDRLAITAGLCTKHYQQQYRKKNASRLAEQRKARREKASRAGAVDHSHLQTR